MKTRKYLIILLIIFSIYTSFFINKAIHIDDIATIYMAREVNKNFFVQISPLYYYNPVLVGYYYAPIVRFFGEKEFWLHIFHLPFSLLVIISMYFLSRRFAKNDLLPTLFLTLTPAFIIMSHNIMFDIPMLGFFLSAMALFIYGIDSGGKGILLLSSLIAACACLTKYSAIILIPILFIYLLLFSKKKINYLFLVIPIFILFLYCLYIIVILKDVAFINAIIWRVGDYCIKRNLMVRVFSCLTFLSGASFITLFLAPFLLRNKSALILFLISIPIGLCPFLMGLFFEYSYFEKCILALLLVLSFFVILVIFKSGLKSLSKKYYNKDNLFLSLWFFIFLIFTILSNFIAVRFVVYLFPPMFLLIFKEINSLSPYFKRMAYKMMPACILITVLISTALSIGDYYFAGIYRDISIKLKKILPKESNVYFYGGDWGYYYYMMSGNYKPLIYEERLTGLPWNSPNKYSPLVLNIENILSKENIFISPAEKVLPVCVFDERKILFNGLNRLKLIKTLVSVVSYRSNVILHNKKFHAGFYSHDWGLFPFYFSLKKVSLERFEIYRLTYYD